MSLPRTEGGLTPKVTSRIETIEYPQATPKSYSRRVTFWVYQNYPKAIPKVTLEEPRLQNTPGLDRRLQAGFEEIS